MARWVLVTGILTKTDIVNLSCASHEILTSKWKIDLNVAHVRVLAVVVRRAHAGNTPWNASSPAEE